MRVQLLRQGCATNYKKRILMGVRLAVSGAAMLALSTSVSAAPWSGIISEPLLAGTPIQRTADCIRYSNCHYRWLRCGNGWCRGPWDPFGGGSIPKIEMYCTTTAEPCAPEQSGLIGTD